MPGYDFSSGFNALNQGIKSLGEGLQQSNQRGLVSQFAGQIGSDKIDDAIATAGAMGDVATVLKLQQIKTQRQGDLKFGAAATALIGGAGAGTAPIDQSGSDTSSVGTPQASAGGISPLAPKAAQYFMSNGVTNPLGAAALAAGFQAESGYNPSAVAKGDGRDGSDAVNIGQWNSQRAIDFRNFYQANKLNPNDPQTGLAFAKYELQNKPEYADVVQKLNAASTPEEAQAAAISYWKPKGWTSSDPTAAADYPRRVGLTKAVYSSLGQTGGPVTSSPVASIASGGASIPAAASGVPSGFTDNPTNRFIASQIGLEATQRLLSVSPDTPMSQILPPGSVNPVTARMTAGQFYQKAQAAAGAAGGAPVAVPPVQVASAAGGVPTPDAGPAALPSGGSMPAGAQASVPPAGVAPPAAASAPGAAPASSIATPANPDPPVIISGKSWTRKAASADDSPSSPSVADVAKAQGIVGDIGATESADEVASSLASGEYKYGEGAGAAPAVGAASAAGTPQQPSAGQDTTVQAAARVSPQVAQSLAQTRPGTQQRQLMLANMLRLAGATSNPEGNSAFVKALMDIEKQNQEQYQKQVREPTSEELKRLPKAATGSKWMVETGTGKPFTISGGNEAATRSLTDPEERASMGYGPLPGTVKPGQMRDNGQPFLPTDPTHLQMDNSGKITSPDKGPLVNIEGQKAESELEKVAGAGQGEIIKEDMHAGNTAGRRLQALSVLNEANKVGGEDIQSGPFAEKVLEGKQLLAELGISIPKGMGPAEVMNKVGFDFATQMVRAISSRPAQMEFLRGLQNVPGLMMSKIGREAMISIQAQEAMNDQKLAILAQDRKNWANWPTVKRDFYQDPANAIMSPFRHGPNGEPVPISRVDVDLMAQKTGLVPKGGSELLPQPLLDVGKSITTEDGITVKRNK